MSSVAAMTLRSHVGMILNPVFRGLKMMRSKERAKQDIRYVTDCEEIMDRQLKLQSAYRPAVTTKALRR